MPMIFQGRIRPSSLALSLTISCTKSWLRQVRISAFSSEYCKLSNYLIVVLHNKNNRYI